MPIEIKELHIRVAVNTPGEGKGTGSAEGAINSGSVSALNTEGKDALMAECAEQVLEILKNRTER